MVYGSMAFTLDNVDGTDLSGLADIVPCNNSWITNVQLRVGIIPAGSTDTVAIRYKIRYIVFCCVPQLPPIAFFST